MVTNFEGERSLQKVVVLVYFVISLGHCCMFDVVGKREQLERSMQWLVHSARNADDRSREYRLAFYLCETHRFAADV